MDAKKLTLAVSFMMVLAAAFVLVVPSDSEADDVEFDITDAQFIKGTTNYALKATISKSVDKGTLFLYYEDQTEPMAERDIPVGMTVLPVVIGPTLDNGTYHVVVTSEYGTKTYDIIWPTPVQSEIKINQSVGGTISADKTTAYAGEEVLVSYIADDNYELVALYMNGEEIDLETLTFIMPAQKAVISGEFNKIVVEYEVTFMFNETMQYGEPVTVVSGNLVAEPTEPAVIGAAFTGWFLEGSEVAFDFSTPVEDDMVLYAHFGPEAPSTEQTNKLVASMVYDEDGVTLIATAYDDGIIGKGTATVTVLQEVDFLGLKAYIEVGTFTIDIDTSESYAYQNISEEASEYITESGNYAMVAEIVLENETTASSNYIVFDAVINEQA